VNWTIDRADGRVAELINSGAEPSEQAVKGHAGELNRLMKHPRLKASRQSEKKKIDLAIKYADQGKATGGGHINPKRARRKLEARNVPMFVRVKAK
jgi:hypothetical protein